MPDLRDLASGVGSWMKKTEEWLEGINEQISDAAFRSWARGEANVAAATEAAEHESTERNFFTDRRSHRQRQ